MSADFLAALFDGYEGERYVEFRFIKDAKVSQRFIPVGQAPFYDVSDWNFNGWDCYLGVLPRDREGGTAADCPFMVRTLWADLDAKTVGSRDVAIRSAVDFPLRPNIIVDSGHGAHAYWLLRDEVEYTTARDIMKGLARELHGDNVSDAPRVLRVPGTTNWKDHEKPEPVRLIYLDVTHKYRWFDFSDLIKPVVYVTEPLTSLAVHEIPSSLSDLIRDGAPRGKRSEAAFSVVLSLLRYGYNAKEIEEFFQENPTGIGEKYHEKGRQGHSWLNYTIQAAKRAIQ